MLKVVCVNGCSQSGKTTFENICVNLLGNRGYAYSSIDWCKDICEQCGWNGEKTQEVRLFLGKVKELFSNTPWGDGIMFNIVKLYCLLKAQIECNNPYEKDMDFLLFVDVREPKNIEKLVKELNAKTVLIKNINAETELDEIDKEVMNYSYDYTIENYKTIEDLAEEAKKFLKEIKAL